ncbi:helix-turn-helix transcriptional regulator [Lysobacter sp. Root667]|uniref:helix-turn-helix domain-containing protein n=1 Tax=Lysobacter sp. Root667 TaxID=1736581 RepID=UPI0009E75D09|nr:helix-turn-helix transcriptional regulator [Lysobacter sp. Root667]
MPTSTLYKKENELLTTMMREMRIAAGLTQAACAEALGKPQSFVSKIEGGSQRIDLIQLREYCIVCETSLTSFVKRFESKL